MLRKERGMAKYRTLNKAELESLQKEFVEFLVTNGVTATDWELLKVEEPLKAEKMVDLFSDIVFEKVLSKVEFLRKTEPHTIICFRFEPQVIKMYGLIADAESEIDFTNKEDVSMAILNPPKGLKVIAREKGYERTRQEEIFIMIKGGCEVDDGKFYHTLALSQKQSLN